MQKFARHTDIRAASKVVFLSFLLLETFELPASHQGSYKGTPPVSLAARVARWRPPIDLARVVRLPPEGAAVAQATLAVLFVSLRPTRGKSRAGARNDHDDDENIDVTTTRGECRAFETPKSI